MKRYSAEPRKMMELEPVAVAEGNPADFLVFDPEGTTTFTKEFMQSKSSNTPFLDKELDGRVLRVVLDGEVLLERD